MTKDIDPLVERVARALCVGTEPNAVSPFDGSRLWERRKPEARAAIAAVLEWYSNKNNTSDEAVTQSGMEFERLDVPDDETYDSSMRRAIAAAMAAELKRRQG